MEAIAELPIEAGYTLSDEEYYAFCQRNADLRFERDPDGKLIIMPNTGGKTGNKNSRLNAFLSFWTMESQTGIEFDSSTAFRLPDGSTRSPDAAWIQLDRWNALTERQQEQFPPLCPDFVVGLLSTTDVLKTARAKMLDVWMTNGCRLAWLIDPKTETTHIFRSNGEIQLVQGFDKILSGEDVLTEFTMPLNRLVM